MSMPLHETLNAGLLETGEEDDNNQCIQHLSVQFYRKSNSMLSSLTENRSVKISDALIHTPVHSFYAQ